MERGLVLLLMRTAAVLLALAIKRRVWVVFPLLVMLWVLFLVIQLLLVLALFMYVSLLRRRAYVSTITVRRYSRMRSG